MNPHSGFNTHQIISVKVSPYINMVTDLNGQRKLVNCNMQVFLNYQLKLDPIGKQILVKNSICSGVFSKLTAEARGKQMKYIKNWMVILKSFINTNNILKVSTEVIIIIPNKILFVSGMLNGNVTLSTENDPINNTVHYFHEILPLCVQTEDYYLVIPHPLIYLVKWLSLKTAELVCLTILAITQNTHNSKIILVRHDQIIDVVLYNRQIDFAQIINDPGRCIILSSLELQWNIKKRKTDFAFHQSI